MNPLLLARLLKFGPWLGMLLGLAVGGIGLRSCAAGLEARGQLTEQVAGLQRGLEAERDCLAGSQCAMRAVTEALAARDLVAQRLDELREKNETRVADAVARYVQAEARTRIDLERAQREIEEQRKVDAACDAWASERVGCIVRPVPFDPGGQQADGGGSAAPDPR